MPKFLRTRENQIINIDHIALVEMINYATSYSIVALFKDESNTTIARFDNEEEAKECFDNISKYLDSITV